MSKRMRWSSWDCVQDAPQNLTTRKHTIKRLTSPLHAQVYRHQWQDGSACPLRHGQRRAGATCEFRAVHFTRIRNCMNWMERDSAPLLPLIYSSSRSSFGGEWIEQFSSVVLGEKADSQSEEISESISHISSLLHEMSKDGETALTDRYQWRTTRSCT